VSGRNSGEEKIIIDGMVINHYNSYGEDQKKKEFFFSFEVTFKNNLNIIHRKFKKNGFHFENVIHTCFEAIFYCKVSNSEKFVL
jgi:hypothetical protein